MFGSGTWRRTVFSEVRHRVPVRGSVWCHLRGPWGAALRVRACELSQQGQYGGRQSTPLRSDRNGTLLENELSPATADTAIDEQPSAGDSSVETTVIHSDADRSGPLQPCSLALPAVPPLALSQSWCC
jgi:hypothetical protein